MIEKVTAVLLRGSWPDGGRDGFPGERVAELLSPAVADALLPQITILDELQALPDDTWLLGTFASRQPGVWQRGDIPDASMHGYLDVFGPFLVLPWPIRDES